jgi:hypothetical protein
MAPAIPDSLITVNKGGRAPMYWYLRSKGHKQMYYPEEQAPAWRLSETGLTPESSGTSTGHRGIFMANYAPWMLRLGYHTRDSFLMQVAKAAIIGRYRSFPGYHINTERTTAYEKQDFPLHEHKEQSVTSFHYNHILPMASMLLDYLVTDVFVRSNAQVDFPSEYIEGYAYLQNKMYGARKGKFYSEKDVQLWMPSRLLRISDNELNYIAARKGDKLMLAFTNQSAKPVTARVTIDPARVTLDGRSVLRFYTAKQDAGLTDSGFTITVPANGLVALGIEGAQIRSSFQQQLLDKDLPPIGNDHLKLKEGNAHAMLMQLGRYDRRLYLYLEDDDNKYRKASLVYKDADGHERTIDDGSYPFEFTVSAGGSRSVSFYLILTGTDGKEIRSRSVIIGQ